MMLLLGALFAVSGYYAYNSKATLLANAATTTAKVVSLRDVQRLGGGVFPVFQFTTIEGSIIKTESSVSTSAYKVGDVVEIFYDPANPQQASINTFWQLWTTALWLGAASGLLLVTGAITLRTARKEKGKA